MSVALMAAVAAIGALSGGLSTYTNSKRQQAQLENEQRMKRAAYGYTQAYDTGMWNLERQQNLENLGIQKNRLGQAFNMDVAGFNLDLEGQAQQNQAAQLSLADSKGMALAQQGASGVKGSDTLQRRIDVNEAQFNRQLDLQERGNSLSMQNMAQQYSNTFSDIGREIESWGPGGYRSEAKSLKDVYEKNMHDLEMKGYEQAIRDAKARPMDYLTGIFGGGASGARFGMQVGNYMNQSSTGSGAPGWMQASWSSQKSFSSAIPNWQSFGSSQLGQWEGGFGFGNSLVQPGNLMKPGNYFL